ncbi:MAG: GAF domain-containing protein, partial [Terriglobia bacterium]
MARRNALLGGALAGLLGLGLVTLWGVQHMVVRPVQRIQAGAQALAAGDLDHRLGMVGDDEIGALADAFNGMAERVQASHDYLEDQVHERTQALLALNAVLTATSASLNLDDVYRAFTEEIRKIVDFDRSSITVFEPAGQAFTVVVVATRERTEVGPGFRGERTPIMEWIITQQRPRIDADPSAALRTGLTTVTGGGPGLAMLLEEGLRSWMLVPIIFRGEVVGTINFASRQVGAYTEADGERLLPIAGQLGVALENARLYEAEKRRAAYLALLNQVGREVLASLNPDELLRRVADAVWRRFGYYNVGVLLLDPQTETLVPGGVAGVAQDEIPQDVRISVGHGVMGHVAATGKTHLANDVAQDLYYYRWPDLETQAQLCVPIKVGDQV